MTNSPYYPQNVKTIGATKVTIADSTIAGRDFYMCANKDIVNGITAPAKTLRNCLLNNPEAMAAARSLFPDLLGTTASFLNQLDNVNVYVTKNQSSSFINAPDLPYTDCTMQLVVDNCNNSTGCGITAGQGITTPSGFLYEDKSQEQQRVELMFDASWRGNFWPNPQAPFSTAATCGANYDNYLKLRLTNATFWATPAYMPVKRDNFMAMVNNVLHINIAGDWSIRVGDIVYLDLDNIPTITSSASTEGNYLSGYYYVLKAHNIFTADYRHETNLYLTQFK